MGLPRVKRFSVNRQFPQKSEALVGSWFLVASLSRAMTWWSIHSTKDMHGTRALPIQACPYSQPCPPSFIALPVLPKSLLSRHVCGVVKHNGRRLQRLRPPLTSVYCSTAHVCTGERIAIILRLRQREKYQLTSSTKASSWLHREGKKGGCH